MQVRHPSRSGADVLGGTSASLDLRGLPAPAPLVQALDAAASLRAGESLDVLTPLMPYPLLQALTEQGFDVAAERRGDGSACVTVRRPLRDPADGTPRP